MHATETARQAGDREQSPDLESDSRWLAVRQLAASSLFVRSSRLSQLLLYLAGETLQGRGQNISEYQIAQLIFGRGEDFDPSSDTIVRSHLLRLRQRLQQHEALPTTAAERYQIVIPRGQYAVEFRPRVTTPTFMETDVEGSVPVELSSPAAARSVVLSIWRDWRVIPLLLLVLSVVAVSEYFWHRQPVTPPSVHPLWSRMFQQGQATTLVAADSSLVVLHSAVRHDTSLADYVSGGYLRDAQEELKDQQELLGIVKNRYSSAVDVSIAQRVTELAMNRQSRAEVRFAREVRLEDLKKGNAILSGSRGANPWLELFEPQMNFLLTSDFLSHRTYVRNRKPLPEEKDQYVSGRGDEQAPLYAVLAFLPNLEPSGNVLILEGTSLAGTEAVRDFLFDDRALLPFLRSVLRPDGSLRHFEVLVAATVVNGNASKFQIVAYRTHD